MTHLKTFPTDNVIKTLLEVKTKPSDLLKQPSPSLRGCLFCSFTWLHSKSSVLAVNSVLKEEHKNNGDRFSGNKK